MGAKKGHKVSEETKRKIGLANKKRSKHYWNNLTPKERAERLTEPSFFKKGHTFRVGLKHSPESRKKMSESHKGVPLSTKHRKALRGRIPYNKGKKGLYKPSKKTLKKRSRAMKKTWKVPKYREKMKKRSDAQRGQERSEETKRKISIKNLGSKRSEEAKRKMREKRVFQVHPKKDAKTTEIPLQKLLKENNIKFQPHKAILGQPDLFIKPNICIFADGDYWHANPKIYESNSVIHKENKSKNRKPVLAKDKWKSDKKITNQLKKDGYMVLRFWEYDINNNPEKCLQKIIKIIKESTTSLIKPT